MSKENNGVGESMLIDQLILHEKLYVKLFSKIVEYPFGYEAYDLFQRDKYYHNYLAIINQHVEIDDVTHYIERTKQHGFSVVRIENQVKIDLPLKEKAIIDCDGYYGNDIHKISINPYAKAYVKRVDPQSDEAFFNFMYEDSKTYGETYAKGQIKRQKEVLIKDHENYMYFQVIVSGLVIGSMNVFMDNHIAKLDDFSIREDMQKKGYGSLLMHEVLDFLKDKGVTYVYLVTDQQGTAKSMYQKWGFEFIQSFETFRWMSQELTKEKDLED